MRPITVRFKSWPLWEVSTGNGFGFFARLIEEVTERPVQIIQDDRVRVDIQFEDIYNSDQEPSLRTRIHRFSHSYLPGGINYKNGKNSVNQQPSGNSRFSVFFTGENERPPEGNWDAYLTFDQHSYGGRNAYLPLWWITSSDILLPTVSPYLGKPITIEQMLSPRVPDYDSRSKFCAAFIGKAYPFRMHALTALSKIGKVDVFGGISRNTAKTRALEKYKVSQDYRFVFCFENDLFPGYVTEKAPEAWATGAVPLYWGSDSRGYFNDKSLINLEKFPTLDEFILYVSKINKSKDLWSEIASQPLLNKRPNLDEVKAVLRNALLPLVVKH
jgi:hypothetical protein